MIDPSVDGAVAVIVNEAAPGAAADARALLSVTEQLSRAPVVLRLVHVTDDTPTPAVTAVAIPPAGS